MGSFFGRLENRYNYLSTLSTFATTFFLGATFEQYVEFKRLEEGQGSLPSDSRGIFIFTSMLFLHLPVYAFWRQVLQATYAFSVGLPGSSRTKFSDYSKVKLLEDELKKSPAPFLHNSGLADGANYNYGLTKDISFKKLEKARKNQDLVQLITFGIDKIRNQSFTEGYEYILEGFDILGGKAIKQEGNVKKYSKSALKELKRDKFFHVKDVEPCLALAAYSVVSQPEKAWYYSELAKRLSDEFLPNKRKQAYLLSSLISTAQQRDDEKIQWEDTVKILHSEPQWERLGESRSIVKRCSLDDFFKNSIVLKESTDRNGLIHEASMLKLVKQSIPEIKTPILLHVTKEPINQNYFLVMRFEKGAKTLYELLQEDPKTPIEPFLDVTCEILKKVNNDFPRQNLFKKIMSKIKSPLLNLPENLTDSLIERFEPITRDLEKTPFGYKKDSISQNLYKVDDQYGAFDFEGNEKVPKLIEFVNLVYYPLNPPIEDIEKLALLFKELSAERGEYSSESYFLNLHQANVYRSFCFLESGSVPGKVNIRASRKTSLENAIQSLDFIIDNEEIEKDNYKYLRADLEEVNKLIQEPYIS